MRIGEFVRTRETTIDTIRHYEDLGLIRPTRVNRQKHYSQTDAENFMAIQELKKVGFSLEDVKLLFDLKQTLGCGSAELLQGVANQFEDKIAALNSEIDALIVRRDNLQSTLDELVGELVK